MSRPACLAYGAGMTRRRAVSALGLLSILMALLSVPGLGGMTAAAAAKQPKVSIGDVSVTETDGAGVVATFDVTLTKGIGKKVKVTWSTQAGSASAADFTAASGKVVFKGPDKKQTKQVQVAITGDNTVEPDETFQVVLTKVKGAKAKKSDGTATIRNDDADHTLTVAPAGNGSGAVTSSPAGINCPGDCVEIYPAGTLVTLTAAPASNSIFTGWSGGGCSGTGTCVTTVDAGRTVVPTFELKTYSLTVTKSGGNGTVTSSPTGISCGATCLAVYTHGTMVSLSSAPATGYVFTGWSGACTGAAACVVTMTAAKSVVATFSPAFTLTVATNGGNGSGSVASAPAGISCGADCTEDYATGTLVTLTPTPATGSTFTGWSGACTGTGACTVTMNAAKTVTASFTLQQFTLTVTAQQNGGSDGKVTSSPGGINCGVGTPNVCAVVFDYGTTIHLFASAGPGFNLSSWSGPCTGQPAHCVFTFTSDTAVTATFNSL